MVGSGASGAGISLPGDVGSGEGEADSSSGPGLGSGDDGSGSLELGLGLVGSLGVGCSDPVDSGGCGEGLVEADGEALELLEGDSGSGEVGDWLGEGLADWLSREPAALRSSRFSRPPPGT